MRRQSRGEDSLVRSAALTSLIGGVILMSVKFWGYTQSGSQAVFSDAMESIVNVIAAGLALFVIYYAMKPADDDHPYGHGKAEYFSSAFEGGLITFAGLVILAEAIAALVQGRVLHNAYIGILVVAGAGIGNLILGLALLRVGNSRKSVALVASGKHLMSDFWTSVAVVGGLLLVWLTGIYWLDSATAIVIGGLLSREGYKLVRSSVGGLLDQEDIEVLQELEAIFSPLATEGIIQIHHVKVIRSGAYHHIDAHLVLPEFWDIAQAHHRTDNFESRVIKNYPYGGEMNFHLDPCRKAYCSVCDLENCPIRV
ncbi:MAG: cation transporter, partial [Bdellovibrionales bacterium]|nr:cation transporter [Bdellovibrionales bacterium]